MKSWLRPYFQVKLDITSVHVFQVHHIAVCEKQKLKKWYAFHLAKCVWRRFEVHVLKVACSLFFWQFEVHVLKVACNTHFFHITHLQLPSPKYPVAKMARRRNGSAELSYNELCMYFALHRQVSSYVNCHFVIPISLFVSSCVSSGHVFSSFPFQFSWFSVLPQHTVTQNKKFQAYTCLRCARRGQRVTSWW